MLVKGDSFLCVNEKVKLVEMYVNTRLHIKIYTRWSNVRVMTEYEAFFR